MNNALENAVQKIYEKIAEDAGKTPTEEMSAAWEKMHVEYIDKVKTLKYKLGKL